MRSLSGRLAFIYSFVALVVTLTLFIFSFGQTGAKAVEDIEIQVSQIVSATEGNAALALFDLNQQAAQQVISSLLIYPFIDQARIRLSNGQLFVEKRNNSPPKYTSSWATRLLVTQQQRLIERDLHAHGFNSPLGKLEILVNYDRALQSFHQQTMLLFINILITTSIVFATIYLVTRWAIAMPLVDLVDNIRHVSPSKLSNAQIEIPKNHQDSEIGVLVGAFNRFIQVLEVSFEKRTAAEDALKKLNLELEQRVAERTAELEAANKKLEQLATTDSLTQLPNRHKFFELANIKFNLFKRYHRPSVVAMLDIDHFKQINDQHGHQVGDAALKVCAQVCLSNLRETDTIGRIGGEEFAIVFSETSLQQAMNITERIRQKMPQDPSLIEQGIKMTISIGLFPLEVHLDNVNQALEYADKALYQAKQGGRNQVKVYAAEPEIET